MTATRTWNAIRAVLTREFIAQFVLFAMPISFAATLAILGIYHFDVRMKVQDLRETEHHHQFLRNVLIRENVRSTIAGLRLLASLHESQEVAHLDAAGLSRTLVRSFRLFCSQNAAYRQIRSVRDDGQETAHVVCRAHRTFAAETRLLVDTSEHGLARSLRTLGAEDAFISKISVEARGSSGEPDGTIRPVVRFAVPLRVLDGNNRLFVVVDVDLRYLVPDVMIDTGRGGTMILVEPDGRFVRKPAGSERWGDTIAPGRELRFATAYPDVWDALQSGSPGMIEARDGLFSFTTLDLAKVPLEMGQPPALAPSARIHATKWHMVSHVPSAEIVSGYDALMLKVILLIPAPFLVALYLAHLAVRRRRAARDLEESERYLRQIMDGVVDGIVTTDPSGQIERANAATVALFGFDSPNSLPSNLAQLVPLGQLQESGELSRFWRHTGGLQRPARAELSLQRKDGTEFPAELVLMEMALSGERRFIWIIRDVSERRAFEEEQNAVRMRFFHQAKMAEIGLIAAGIIHEVGNPIAAISGMVTEMAEEAAADGTNWSRNTREMLGLMADHAQRLGGITREISDFVRSRPGVVELFDLNSLIRSTVRLVAFDARWKQIQIDLELDPSLLAILGIQDQIAQLLMNLLVNAADAVQNRPAGNPRVAVRTENRPAHVLLIIADNGHGMDAETRKRAFDQFFTTKAEGKGTGLGLSLCQSIVATHNGSIEVDTVDGEGTTFRIGLPLPANLGETIQ